MPNLQTLYPFIFIWFFPNPTETVDFLLDPRKKEANVFIPDCCVI